MSCTANDAMEFYHAKALWEQSKSTVFESCTQIIRAEALGHRSDKQYFITCNGDKDMGTVSAKIVSIDGIVNVPITEGFEITMSGNNLVVRKKDGVAETYFIETLSTESGGSINTTLIDTTDNVIQVAGGKMLIHDGKSYAVDGNYGYIPIGTVDGTKAIAIYPDGNDYAYIDLQGRLMKGDTVLCSNGSGVKTIIDGYVLKDKSDGKKLYKNDEVIAEGVDTIFAHSRSDSQVDCLGLTPEESDSMKGGPFEDYAAFIEKYGTLKEETQQWAGVGPTGATVALSEAAKLNVFQGYRDRCGYNIFGKKSGTIFKIGDGGTIIDNAAVLASSNNLIGDICSTDCAEKTVFKSGNPPENTMWHEGSAKYYSLPLA